MEQLQKQLETVKISQNHGKPHKNVVTGKGNEENPIGLPDKKNGGKKNEKEGCGCKCIIF
jgi:hypothetical protein